MARLRKDVAEFLDRQPGWSFDRYTGSGHLRVVHEEGAIAFLPQTPSDHRSLPNCVKKLKKSLATHRERQRPRS